MFALSNYIRIHGTTPAARHLALAILAAAICWTSPCLADVADAGPPTRTAPDSQGAPAAPVRYCGLKSVLIRYRWQGPAPAGVQMWIRMDNQTWLTWRWTDQPAEPIALTPPRQGSLAIALAPAAQETADPPGPDAQTLSIVFDWDKPLLRLVAVKPADRTGPRTAADSDPASADSPAGALRLTWAAWDENFGDRPISLYWRATPTEPWRLGAADLPNSGIYEWDAPAEMLGRHLEISLRAIDLAGNLTEATTTVEPPARPAQPAPAPTPKATPAEQSAASQPAAPQPAVALDTMPADNHEQVTVSQEAERLNQLAQQQIARGSSEVAEDLLRQALEADPLFHPARLQLAILLQRRGQFQQAIREYESVLGTRPDNTTAWRNLALTYMAAKEYPKARVTLQKLLAVEANNPQTWLDLGDVEMLSGRPDAARQNWERARSISKPNTETAGKADKRLKAYVKNGS